MNSVTSINTYNNLSRGNHFNTQSKNIETLSEKVNCVSQQRGFPTYSKFENTGAKLGSFLSSRRVFSIKHPSDANPSAIEKENPEQSTPADSFHSTAIQTERDESNHLSSSTGPIDLTPTSNESQVKDGDTELEKFYRKFTQIVDEMKERVRQIGKMTQDESSITKNAIAQMETFCKNFDEISNIILETINHQKTFDLFRSFVSYFDKISELSSNGEKEPPKKFIQRFDRFVISIKSKMSPEQRAQFPELRQTSQAVPTRKSPSSLPVSSNTPGKRESADIGILKKKLVNIVKRINGYLEKCKNPEEEIIFSKCASNKRSKVIKSFNLLGNIPKYIQNREVFDLVKQFITAYNAISDWQKIDKPDSKVCYFHHVCIFFDQMKQACTDLQKQELDSYSKRTTLLSKSMQCELLKVRKNLSQLLERMRKVVNILPQETSLTVSRKKHYVFSIFKKRINEISKHLNDPEVSNLVKEFGVAFDKITRWQIQHQLHLNPKKRSLFFLKSCPELFPQIPSSKSDKSGDEKQQISGASLALGEGVLQGSDENYSDLLENIKLIVENAQTFHQELLGSKINRERISVRKRSLKTRFNKIEKICSLHIKDPIIFKFTIEFAKVFDEIANFQKSPSSSKLGFFSEVFKEFLDEIRPKLTPDEMKQFPDQQANKNDDGSKSGLNVRNQKGRRRLKRQPSESSSIESDSVAKEPPLRRRRCTKDLEVSSLSSSEEEISGSSSYSTSFCDETSPSPVNKRVVRNLRSGRLQSCSIEQAAQRTPPDSQCPDTLNGPSEASSCVLPAQASDLSIYEEEISAPTTVACNALSTSNHKEVASVLPTGTFVSNEAFDTNMFFSEDFL